MSHRPSRAHGIARRTWLQAAVGSLGLGMLPRAALAAGSNRALVCVFLSGGNDGFNSLVPTDARYTGYQQLRQSLAVGSADLVGLSGVPFGLHPALAPLASLWQTGQMAAVFNVGPLVRPISNRDEFLSLLRSNPEQIPPSLFSHSDQVNLWQSADLEFPSRSGWGGRAAQLVSAQRAVVSMGGNARFGASSSGPGLALPGPGNDFRVEGLHGPSSQGMARTKALAKAFAALYADTERPAELTERFVAQTNQALRLSEELAETVKLKHSSMGGGDPIAQAFGPLLDADANQTGGSRLASQLFQVAKLIRFRGQSGGPQIYFVNQGGYDTHGDQLARHPRLLDELSKALAAFHLAMNKMGVSDAVTSFTSSEFGRTLAPNYSGGTDHAWGNTQFVMGGAVRGGLYGTLPKFELGGSEDSNLGPYDKFGRVIPTLAVEQYAATLLNWLGVNDAQLGQVLPNLGAFNQRNLGFMA